MERDETLKLLKAHKAEMEKQFGITDLALFGSISRGTAGPESDIDILVSFDGPATSSRYFGLQFILKTCLACALIWSPTRHCGRNFALMWSGRQFMSDVGIEVRN